MTFTDNITEKFKEATGYDLLPFFIVSNAVLSKYSRNSNDLSIFLMPKVRTVLNQLKITVGDINRQYDIYRGTLGSDTRYFELIEQIDIIDNALDTMLNAKKWGKYFKNTLHDDIIPEMDYIIRQNETLEDIALHVLNSQDFLNEWFDIALNNDLEEEDYTFEGNVALKLPLHVSGLKQLQIESIVDVIDDETIKGKDIKRKFEFINDDIDTVGGITCALQACEILAGLRKGDNPEYPEHGLSSNFVVGVSTAFFNYPVIIRQMLATFDNDDSFTEFQINSFKQLDDIVIIDFQVKTRTNEIINKQLEF